MRPASDTYNGKNVIINSNFRIKLKFEKPVLLKNISFTTSYQIPNFSADRPNNPYYKILDLKLPDDTVLATYQLNYYKAGDRSTRTLEFLVPEEKRVFSDTYIIYYRYTNLRICQLA